MDRTQNSPQHWQTGIPTLKARESYQRRLGRRLRDECGGGAIFPAPRKKNDSTCIAWLGTVMGESRVYLSSMHKWH
jgi:hypothetical protein